MKKLISIIICVCFVTVMGCSSIEKPIPNQSVQIETSVEEPCKVCVDDKNKDTLEYKVLKIKAMILELGILIGVICILL